MTKQEFLDTIERLKAAIDNDDTFEGRLAYEVDGANRAGVYSFSVDIAFRIGNRMGQGGYVIVRDGTFEQAEIDRIANEESREM